MKPTPRQLFLLGFAGRDQFSLWRVTDTQRSYLTRPYEYARTADRREPSKAELDKMVASGWIELREDPGSYTLDTRTGIRSYHSRVWLTEAGRSILSTEN